MAEHDTHDKRDKHQPGRASVAVFASRAEAREAISALHAAHFGHTWLGVTSVAATTGGEPTMTVESPAGGFFSDTQSLVDAFVSRGVLGDTAREVEASIAPGEALVIVDPKDQDPSDAVMILEEHGGHVGGRVRRTGTIVRPATAMTAATSDVRDADELDEEMFYRRESSLR